MDRYRSCCGSMNWSPPNAATQGFIPPVPTAIRTRPSSENSLQNDNDRCFSSRFLIDIYILNIHDLTLACRRQKQQFNLEKKVNKGK